jgi:hypothetical protein
MSVNECLYVGVSTNKTTETTLYGSKSFNVDQ